MNFPYILTDDTLTIVIGTKAYSAPANPELRKAIANPDTTADEMLDIVNRAQGIVNFMQGEIALKNGVLFYRERPLDNNLTAKILEFMEAGEPELAKPLINFLENVMENPSYRAAQGLYEWVSKSGLPISEDGYILAWKAVRDDYFDHYTGNTLDHTPGNIVEQPRNECDEDPDQTCSNGIHFCSPSYLTGYMHSSDTRVVLVKIHPADVVAIPRDYGVAKGRCCRMEILSECPKEDVDEYFKDSLVYNEPEDYDENDDYDFDFEVGQIWEMRNDLTAARRLST